MSKFLVTYATHAGSTAEVAAQVAQALRSTGAAVDVRPLKTVREVKGYDAVVVGSAVGTGDFLPEAVAFVKANREPLSHIPMAYFLVSGFLREDTPQMRQKVLAFLDLVRTILEPISIGLFTGKMDGRKLSWLGHSMAKKVSMTEGDQRNGEAILAWARGLRLLSVHH